MAPKLVWPPPAEEDAKDEHWRSMLQRWDWLSSDDKLSVLKLWSEGQDRHNDIQKGRITRLEMFVRIVVAAVVGVATIATTVLMKDVVGQYQIVHTNQIVLPAPTGAPSTAPDFQKTGPRP